MLTSRPNTQSSLHPCPIADWRSCRLAIIGNGPRRWCPGWDDDTRMTVDPSKLRAPGSGSVDTFCLKKHSGDDCRAQAWDAVHLTSDFGEYPESAVRRSAMTGGLSDKTLRPFEALPPLPTRMLVYCGQYRIVEDPFGMPLSSIQATLAMHLMFARISRDFSMVSPCVTNPTGCNNVLLAIRTSIRPSGTERKGARLYIAVAPLDRARVCIAQ